MHAVFLLITVNAMAQDQTVSTLKTEAENDCQRSKRYYSKKWKTGGTFSLNLSQRFS